MKKTGFDENACLLDLTVREALGLRVAWFNPMTRRFKLGRIIGIWRHVVHLKMADGHVQRVSLGSFYLPNAPREGSAVARTIHADIVLPDVAADICPSCGNVSFVAIEGCQTCYSCGYSEC